MLCQNKGQTVAKFEIDTKPGSPSIRHAVAPGDKVEIPDGYCKPYTNGARRTAPPIITQIHASMIPCPGEYAPGHVPPVTDEDPRDREIRELKATVGNMTAQFSELVELIKSGGVELTDKPAAPAPSEGEGDKGPIVIEADALGKMSMDELRGLADDMGLEVKSRSKAGFVEAILADASDEDEPEDGVESDDDGSDTEATE